MKYLHRILIGSLLSSFLLFGSITKLHATAIIWMLNPVSGDIVSLDPSNGTILGSFPAPVKPATPFDPLNDPFPPPTGPYPDTRAGLTIADHGRTLLYQLGNNGPFTDPSSPEVIARTLIYGIDIFTGEVKYQTPGLLSGFGPDGLSWQPQGDDGFTFFAHANPIPDIHRIKNIDKPYEYEDEEVFWGPTFFQGDIGHFPVGGLGGDGYGREFGAFSDDFNQFDGHRYIGEYSPYTNNARFINTFLAPADDIEGLAFDGKFLYASSASGSIYTLDPDDGTIINSILLPPLFFSDGSFAPYSFDIAAKTPEPPPPLLIGMACIYLYTRHRHMRRKRLGMRV